MIVKIKSHKKGCKKLLDYMLANKDRLFDKNNRSFILKHNLRGNSLNKWIEQFNENETYRKNKRKDSVQFFHHILSFHRDDTKHLNLEKLETMTRAYINLYNDKGMFLAVPHWDKTHLHVHVCASGVEFRTGKGMRLSKPQLIKVKKELQQFQMEKYPELSNSLPKHGKKEKSLQTEKEYQFKCRTGRESDKSKLLDVLNECFKKANSKDTFFKILTEAGIQPYSRGGKISGVHFAKKKFRLKRIGFGEDKLEELNKRLGREKEILRTRSGNDRSMNRIITRSK